MKLSVNSIIENAETLSVDDLKNNDNENDNQ